MLLAGWAASHAELKKIETEHRRNLKLGAFNSVITWFV